MKSLPDGTKIFMTDMGDLFGAWVPEEWIKANLGIVDRHPKLIFQFLTKNPKRYAEFSFPANCWLGTTWDGLPLTDQNVNILCDSVSNDNVSYVSFEPLLRPYRGELPIDAIDWIIIGEETGRALTQEEVHNIWQSAGELIEQAKQLNIPVFVKNQLGHTYKQREWPRER